MEVPELWESDSEYKPLRQPSSAPNSDKSSLSGSSLSSDGDHGKSPQPLRAEAQEWFPKGYNSSRVMVGSVSSAQERLRNIRLSEPPKEPELFFDSAKLESILQSLTYDPGQFDSLLEMLMEYLEPYFGNLEASQTTANMIFQFALIEPSLRYNAARLCCSIDEYSPMFRSHLHILCEKELQSNNNGQGLTLFLAELYMQMNYGSIHERFLILSIEKLLQSGQEEDLKCICKTLKLTGYSLEETYSQKLDEIFSKLEQLKPSLSQSLNNIIESTVNLRRNHWGRNVASNNVPEQNGEVPVNDVDSICYGPDGQEITREEHEFLCANIEEYLAGESSDPDDLFDPEPEMDEEIQQAFREFVKMGRQL